MSAPFRRIAAIFLFILYFFPLSSAQYTPKQDAKLNYTEVCFEFPWVEKATLYVLHLEEQHPGKRPASPQLYDATGNKIVVHDLTFGSSYSWFIEARDKENNLLSKSPMLKFSLAENLKTGREHVRYRKVAHKPKAGNELLILDYTHTVVDRDLKPVWYLPPVAFMHKNSGLRDLKLTDDGTFLAIIDSNAYELDLNGKVLWKAPNDGKVSGKKGVEDYHHDLQKLPSGNYMVLGNERMRHRFPGQKDTTVYDSGTIIEYSPKGQVVWEWHAKDFFTEEMLMMRRRDDGMYDPATHLNAFNVDGKYIYAGFRDASWILKINKATKQVEEIYGGSASGLSNHYAQGLFRYQHAATVLRDGNIAIVNNDSIKDPKVVSSLLVFSTGSDDTDKGELLFRFPFDYDSLSDGKSLKLGNVLQLRSGNYLVNMGAINRVFEVTPRGEVVWDVFIEKLDTFKRVWRFFPQYRVAAASSLYPNEFSYRWEPKLSEAGTVTGQIYIGNVGSETNSYTIYFQPKAGAPKELRKVKSLLPGEERVVAVSIPLELAGENGDLPLIIQVDGKSKRETLLIKR